MAQRAEEDSYHQDFIDSLKDAYQAYLNSKKDNAIIDIGDTRVMIFGKPKEGKESVFNIVVCCLPLNMEQVFEIVTNILMIVIPLLSLKKNTNGQLIFSHAIETGSVKIFIDDDPPAWFKDIEVSLSNFIDSDIKSCLKRLLPIIKRPMIKSLVDKEKQLLMISSLKRVNYCGLTYAFEGTMETSNIRVYLNPKLFRSIATLPAQTMQMLLQRPSCNDLTLAGAVYGNKVGVILSKDAIKERFVGKKGNSLVYLQDNGITALRCIERMFLAHIVSPDTKITVIFSNDVAETFVDIRTGTNQQEFAYAPDVVEGMGPCVLETPLIRSK